jgi:predicted metal-dependent HD superfamily phosphohydrolase
MPRDRLAGRWAALLGDCGVDPTVAAPQWDALVAAYGGPGRAYHGLEHLEHLFAELDGVPLRESAVAWAAWYHDAVYRVGRRDNELRSAALARRGLEAMGLQRLVPRVERLIVATRLHQAEADDVPALLFLDADMAILGAAPVTYLEYARGVRNEHRAIPRLLFERGRRAFLSELLGRPAIFATAHFRRKYELQARENLRGEMARLEAE